MTSPQPRDLAASVRQRLMNRSRETDRPFAELLQYYAMERFLYRLSTSPHARRFVLKGALMFLVWKAPRSRATMDIDLLGRTSNRVEDVVDVVREICTQAVEPDGLSFDPASVSGATIDEGADYVGVRVRFRGLLGVARVAMQLDIGFSDKVVPNPRSIVYPTLLGMPAPRVRGYSRESTISEKLHAMVKRGLLNSRMKDFYDVALLATHFDFDGERLTAAIRATFGGRGTPIPSTPTAFTAAFVEDPAKQAQWSAFLRNGRLSGEAIDLRQTVAQVAAFLLPILAELSADRGFQGEWRAPGPWTSAHHREVE